ncbi:MAG: hypothetical protein ACRDKC_02940 [Gaiellaceae bacterium]
MSEEQRNEETEVEAHRYGIRANDEPQDEVEGHGGSSRLSKGSYTASDEPRDEAETDDEVEGHASKVNHPKFN